MGASRAAGKGAQGNRFVRWGERQLERNAGGRFGSLLFGCVGRYAESSRNSVSALVVNVFLSVLPGPSSPPSTSNGAPAGGATGSRLSPSASPPPSRPKSRANLRRHYMPA
jgi:hypothetical protein